MDVLPRLRFSFARWFDNAPASLVVASVGAVAIVTALGWAAMKHEEVAQASDQLLQAEQLPLPKRNVSQPSSSADTLPLFSGAALVQGMNSVAKDVAIPFDEAVYMLDSSAAMPYKTYRVTIKTVAGYAEIRRFLPALAAELPNVHLDTIHCVRPDLAATTLSCELAFSAFFSKAARE